ncbi:hypothetical protein V9T40_012728 [Parthenolecanium corni]|uniref:Carboxylesterase type B domain-containing protein n=1 Tax=Parthenolecanium corni TaxID=536013 RepID=A0AAN9T7T0_9HEMI
MFTLLRIILVLVSFSLTFCVDLEEVVTVIKQGKLVGVKLYTAEKKKQYLSFSNIPYAKPPLGNLRFKAPQDPLPWKGIRTLKFPPVCHQWVRNFDTSTFYGQEDCLYLNVFTPVLNENAKLPVVVCIHGGDFQRGSNYECPANNFMEKNIVFVSFNYRLGIFGFLSAGDEILPGNFGLKDQVAALKWVRNNIRSFGGDPEKVTIMGQGAGGASVHYHLYSLASKGLFRAAISQSATALAPWAYSLPETARNRTFALGRLMKCSNETTGDILLCLRKVQSKTLVEMQPQLSIWFSEPNVLFNPTTELKSIDNAFFTNNRWLDTEINKVPWMIGFTSGEGVFKSSAYFGKNATLLEKFNKEIDSALPIILNYGETTNVKDVSTITEALKKFYFNNSLVTTDSARGLIDLFTDSLFSYGCMKAASRYAGRKYFYLFDHLNQNTFSQVLTSMPGLDQYKMASHGDDMVSLHYVPWLYLKKDNLQMDIEVTHRMVNYWTNFIRLSNPNGESDEIVWSRMKSNFEHLHIKTEKDVMESNLWKEKYSFWESLPLLSKIESADVLKSEIKKDEL